MLTSESVRSTALLLQRRLTEAGFAPQQNRPYDNQAHTLAVFIALTRDIDRATLIFEAVLQQALTLGKSTAWVETELSFESCMVATLQDRQQSVLGLLNQRQELTEERLDEYIERSTRFKS